jgi:hypothetical protein
MGEVEETSVRTVENSYIGKPQIAMVNAYFVDEMQLFQQSIPTGSKG